MEFGFRGRVTRGSVDAIVVGCGVIGLSVAVSLQEAGLDVRVLTVAPPSETTSTVAAALWYPYKSYPEDRVLPWGKRTYEVFAELSHVTVSGGVPARGRRALARADRGPMVDGGGAEGPAVQEGRTATGL